MVEPLFVVFGATGAQGAPVADRLLAQGKRVRVVARSADKLARFAGRAEIAQADLSDADAVQQALEGAAAAFTHLPIPSGPQEAMANLQGLLDGAQRARLPWWVHSTSGFSGARYEQTAFIAGNTATANAVLASGVPALVLQPTVYLENLLWPHLVEQLRTQGVLDYPPLSSQRRMNWTSQVDQAVLAAAALQRPDLAGRALEIATPGSLTGSELADALSTWVGRPVAYRPLSPAAFGQQLAQAFGSQAVGQGIAEMYAAVDRLPADGLVIDAAAAEALLGVQLPSVRQHIAGWARP